MNSLNNTHTITISASTQQSSQQIELTPLIDIIFIVIVFLLLTANTQLLSLPVTVPETNDIPDVASTDQNIVTVTVAEGNNGWFIDKEYFSDWDLFKSSLSEAINSEADVAVNIAADQQADVQRFVKVLTLLQQQQVTDTNIILQNE